MGKNVRKPATNSETNNNANAGKVVKKAETVTANSSKNGKPIRRMDRQSGTGRG